MHVPARDQPASKPAAPARTAAARACAGRWTKHPDPEQKGVMVPDVSAAEYGRFNPPTNE